MDHRFCLEFDAADLAHSQRLRRWQELVGDHLADVDMHQPLDISSADAYCGSMRLDVTEAVTFARVRSANQLLFRSPQRIRRAERETVLLNVMISGECRLQQEDRRVLLRPGDICLYESVRSYEIATPGAFEVLVVMADRQQVEPLLANLRLFTARTLSEETPAGAVAASYWRGLASRANTLNDAELAAFTRAGFEIVGAALGSSALDRADETQSTELAVQRARLFMKANLHRPHLHPEEIARGTGLSLRRLQEVFQAQGMTIMGCLRDIRLEMARRYLSDPVFARQPIGQVMGSVGFFDQSQFAHAFRKAYGESPREFRRRVRP